jgi:hypothetical protein
MPWEPGLCGVDTAWSGLAWTGVCRAGAGTRSSGLGNPGAAGLALLAEVRNCRGCIGRSVAAALGWYCMQVRVKEKPFYDLTVADTAFDDAQKMTSPC